MQLRPKNHGQKNLLYTIDHSIVTLCAGIAGTGKSICCIAKACELFLAGKVSYIIIARPAVECGKGLGFLKGNLEEKIEPYMRPILQILNKFFTKKDLSECIARKTIELAPLEYMRGMTYDDTCMVLDEAQNATYEQIKMFMTRIGQNSKMIIVGDNTQRDITGDKGQAYTKILEAFDTKPYVDGVNIAVLTEVVRNDIIQRILDKLGE